MSDDNRLNRRRVLQGAAAGMASFGATGLATADGTSQRPWADVPTETIGDVHFAELGIEFDVDLPTLRPGCPGAPYFVHQESGELLFPTMDQELRKTVESEDSLLRHDGYQSLPTRITRGDFDYLPASTTKRLGTRASVPVEKPVPVPAIRVETTDGGSLSVAVGGRSGKFSVGEAGTVELNPTPVRAAKGHGPPPKVTRDGVTQRGRTANGGAPVEATPKIKANNLGRLTVKAVDSSEVRL